METIYKCKTMGLNQLQSKSTEYEKYTEFS